ncbi:MAG: hypothetical protein JNK30_18310 [Phenylobacterium sp.]|uniref:hypothetical protein n=1 Tax=Phenylobacterium sp. TaxID=1871053 RepID=UPI001A4E6AAE|nr:hypothetical protein [Phenylobacterium sp.]MBL8773343.1 hypothetical protein [Phenylobacterium sp.]
MRLVACLALIPVLASCASAPAPRIEYREVKVAVPVKCAADPGPSPAYSDTPEALRAAGDMLEKVKLLLAGRKQRDARILELEAASSACGSVPTMTERP